MKGCLLLKVICTIFRGKNIDCTISKFSMLFACCIGSKKILPISFGGQIVPVPAPCRDGDWPPEPSSSPSLPPGWVVSSSPMDYGFVAVVSWYSIPLVVQYNVLVSCPTWSRSIRCNMRCVCWDPMDCYIMISHLCLWIVVVAPLLYLMVVTSARVAWSLIWARYVCIHIIVA